MADQKWQATHHIDHELNDKLEILLQEANQYSFYRLIEHLYRLHGEDVEDIGLSSNPFQRVTMQGDASLAFPVSDVVSAKILTDDPQEEAQYSISTSFFSLHGADSPLQGYYFDQLAYDAAHDIGIRPAFFNFFNNRLLTLLNFAWRKYRYHSRFQHSATDGFSKYVFALIGLSDDNLRGSTPIPWSRLLSFVGIIASRSRSPSVVSGIIRHCFDLDAVSIREFEQRYVDIPASQKNSLGQKNMSCGQNFMLGARVSTKASKFTIVISELTQKRFRDFLPNGKDFEPLRCLIDFLLRDNQAYDLELGLQQKEIPAFQLSPQKGAHLGWTTFLPQDAPLCLESVVKIKARS